MVVVEAHEEPEQAQAQHGCACLADDEVVGVAVQPLADGEAGAVDGQEAHHQQHGGGQDEGEVG